MNINWKIISKDLATNSMVVEYSGDVHTSLNIPIPTADKNINDWIQQYLPHHHQVQQELHEAPEGSAGTFTIEPVASADAATETPKVIGSWNEEYVRALIYTVLEEIRESTV